MHLVIRNAKVWTVDERRPRAEAVAVRDARIVAVGDDLEVRDAVAGPEELDAGGRTVRSGFFGAPERSLAFGRPEIDAGTGEPTGFVTDFAVMGLSRDGQAALAEQVPNFAPDEMYRRLLRSLDMAAELGITTAVEPQNSVDDLPLFRRARDDGAMRSRVIAALCHPPGTTSEELDAFGEAK